MKSILGDRMKAKRRIIVRKKDVKSWCVLGGEVLSSGYRTREQARQAAKSLSVGPGRHKYFGRCAFNYRYIILDTH